MADLEFAEFIGPDLGGGSYLWIGTVSAPNGRLYGIPFNCNRILEFDPITEETEYVGSNLSNREFKWCMGVLGYDGFIYGCHYNSRRIL